VTDTLTFYRTRLRRQWRWRLTAANHKVIGAATEAYHNRDDCVANAARVLDFDTPALEAAEDLGTYARRRKSPNLKVVTR